MPGHTSIEGNEIADELAKGGVFLELDLMMVLRVPCKKLFYLVRYSTDFENALRVADWQKLCSRLIMLSLQSLHWGGGRTPWYFLILHF